MATAFLHAFWRIVTCHKWIGHIQLTVQVPKFGVDSIITGLSLEALSGSSEHTQRNAIALSHTKSHANQAHERLMEIKLESFLAPT